MRVPALGSSPYLPCRGEPGDGAQRAGHHVGHRVYGSSMPLKKPWNLFLTGSDRAVLEAMPPVVSDAAGQRTALVLLNVTAESFAIMAADAAVGGDGSRAQRALQPLQDAVELARQAGVPIVHARWGGDAAEDDRGLDTVLRARPKDTLVTLTTPSAFWKTDLEERLQAMAVDSLVLIGGAAATAVRATAMDAQARGFRVASVATAVFDRFEASFAIAMFDLHLLGVDLIDQSTLAERFRAQSPLAR